MANTKAWAFIKSQTITADRSVPCDHGTPAFVGVKIWSSPRFTLWVSRFGFSERLDYAQAALNRRNWRLPGRHCERDIGTSSDQMENPAPFSSASRLIALSPLGGNRAMRSPAPFIFLVCSVPCSQRAPCPVLLGGRRGRKRLAYSMYIQDRKPPSRGEFSIMYNRMYYPANTSLPLTFPPL